MAEKYKRDPWRGRRCKYCKLVFVPSERADARTADLAKFCQKSCKDKFRFNGGINFDQLTKNATRAVIKALLADETFLEAIADKMRVRQDDPPIERRRGQSLP